MQIRKVELSDFEQILVLNKELFLNEKQYSPSYNEDWPTTNNGKEYFALHPAILRFATE